MYFLRKTFELAVCLLGYWIGRGYSGWGGGILLAFVGLCATSFGWEYVERHIAGGKAKPDLMQNLIYGAISAVAIVGASYLLWGKY